MAFPFKATLDKHSHVNMLLVLDASEIQKGGMGSKSLPYDELCFVHISYNPNFLSGTTCLKMHSV